MQGPDILLFESYSVLGGARVFTNLLGSYDTLTSTFELLDHNEIWDRRSDLGGVELISSTMPWPPLTFPDLETGFVADLVNVIAENGNFSVRTVEPEDRRWGTPLDDSGETSNL